MACIFCNCGTDLKPLTSKGISTIIDKSILRGDGLHLSLDSTRSQDFSIHNACRTKYNDPRNIARFLAGKKTSQNIDNQNILDNIDADIHLEICAPNSVYIMPENSEITVDIREPIFHDYVMRDESVLLLTAINDDDTLSQINSVNDVSIQDYSCIRSAVMQVAYSGIGEFQFNFSEHCLFCDCVITQRNCNRKGCVAQIKDSSTQLSLANECANRNDKEAVELSFRLLAPNDLVQLKARYHTKCFRNFKNTTRRHLLRTVSPETDVRQVNLENTDLHSPQQDSSSLEPVYDKEGLDSFENELSTSSVGQHNILRQPHNRRLSVRNCGATKTHHTYLQNVASYNNMLFFNTVGGGNCFFDAIRQGLQEFGIHNTIPELRSMTADQLELHRAIYQHLYRVDDNGQQEQATTYDLFISGTRDGVEWSTELTLCCMARALGIQIVVVSTSDGIDGNTTAFIEPYSDGVISRARSLYVGFNKATGHYTGFGTLGLIDRHAEIEIHSTPMENNEIFDESPSIEACLRAVERRLSRMSVDEDLAGATRSSIIDMERRFSALSHMDMSDGQSSPTSFVNVGDAANSSRQDNSHSGEEGDSDVFEPDSDAGEENSDVVDPDVVEGEQDCINASQLYQQCQNCGRKETLKCPLSLVIYKSNAIKRKFSLLPRNTSDPVLCELCYKYLRRRRHSLSTVKLWNVGWPSIIGYLLVHRDHQSIRDEIWMLLPFIHRESWKDHATAIDFNLTEFDPPLFEDYTAQRNRYETLIHSGNIGDFLIANNDYAFPCIKCPAGCFAYLDECSPLPFSHVLSWKFGLNFYNGRSKFLNGARKDWPSHSLHLSTFNVTAGLVTTDTDGLCVLLCKSHGKGLQKSFVHVPRNPVLGDLGFQFPDSCAAAALTPNIIRRGMMSTWTSSSHVVMAVGGYTGISSSSIAEKVDMKCGVDDRLWSSSCLAMSHRPEIAEVFRMRYANVEGAQAEMELDRELYDNGVLLKPTPEQEARSILGATFIDISDSYGINNRMFSRGTRDTGVGEIASEQESSRFSLTFVHPSNQHGCEPINIQKLYKIRFHVITGFLLQALIHCPMLHDVVLDAFDVQRCPYLQQLLGFVKYCAGQTKMRLTRFKNAAESEKKSKLQLTQRNVPRGSISQSAILLLTTLSEEIISTRVTFDTNILEIDIPDTAKICIVYRVDSRRWSKPHANNIRDFHLMAIFCGESMTNTFYFRWNERLGFWKVTPNDKKSSFSKITDEESEGGLIVHDWKCCIYVKSRKLAYMNEQLEFGLKGQHLMRCDVDDLFLVRQPVSCEFPCCFQDCSRNARWTCQGNGQFCPHAVCLCHGNDILKGNVIVNIEMDLVGRVLPVRPTASVNNNIADVVDGDELNDHGSDSEDEIFVPIGINEWWEESGAPPKHTRQDIIPIYSQQNLLGHYLWNHRYNVMKRSCSIYSNVRANAILEHIVASTKNASVSLLYPEAQLFPRIFWCGQSESILGAIPSFMLNSASTTFDGLASLSDHHDIRIRDGDLLTSKQNDYWHYLFDLKLNNMMNHSSSEMVFKRGLEFLLENRPEAGSGDRSAQEARLPMDNRESKRRVHELASLLKHQYWSYFMTLSVNDAETPGVREITKAIKTHANGNEEKEAELTEAFLPFILRAWERFVRIFLQELIVRNDSIVGKVKNLFYRFEFQGAGSKGNKPHVHCGISLEEEDKMTTIARICCCTLTFYSSLYGTEYDTLFKAGIVTDELDYARWRTVVSYVQHHDCIKNYFRCCKETKADGTRVCRWKKQPEIPLLEDDRGWFDVIHMPYPEDVYEILAELNLAVKVYDHLKQEDKWILDECLRGGKWHYPARQDEYFVATIPIVSAICRSQCNVEMCNRKFQVSYLLKYVAGHEERQLCDIRGTKDVNVVNVTTEEHAHEKITGSRHIQEKKEKANPHLGREICLAEVVWFVLGFPYTYCTAAFVNVPTLPLEDRVGVLRHHKFSANFVSGDSIVPVAGRIASVLPDWRRFTANQVAHIEGYKNSPYCLDATSAFNIRPPELLFFNDLQRYCECFVSTGTAKSVFKLDLSEQCWFDGASRRIKLRSCSIAKALAYVIDKARFGNEQAEELLHSVFEPISRGEVEFLSRFVQQVTKTDVVSVVSLVNPCQRAKFIVHLCLTLGRYNTEMDIFCVGDIREAFLNAGLLTSIDVITRADILAILKMYVCTDLIFHPIPARAFGRYLKAALQTLQDVFFDGILSDYTPCLSDIMIKEKATNEIIQLEQSRKANLITGLFDDVNVRDILPEDLAMATLDNPVPWIPSIVPVDGISHEVVQEQTSALLCCTRAIDKFLDPRCRGLKFPCLVGRPGSGKSHVLKIAVAYALSKGLAVELLSWTSERARKLGGRHLHLVFPLAVTNSRMCFKQDIVNKCLRKLEQDAGIKMMLMRTDVFVFEEIGLLSAEYFVALDDILRSIMGNTLPWGGKLLLSCGDAKQLPPIEGQPIWACINMCTVMEIFVFKADVRARDPNLQWLTNECRRQLTPEECRTAAEVVLRECRFVNTWADVPDIAVRIVPTKAAEFIVMEEFLAGRVTTPFVAMDEVQNGTVWEKAGNRITKRLNANCYEYDVCRLYVNAVVRMTFNDRQHSTPYSQGQIAIVVDLPIDNVPFNNQRLRLRLSPPGVRDIDINNIPAAWPEIVIAPHTTQVSIVGPYMQKGRRTQWPVRYYLCSTVHRIQGDTVLLLATQMSDSRKEFRFWLKEQFAVLISRVQRCQDIIFVGSRSETKAEIERIMGGSSMWDRLIEHYMAVLDVAVRPLQAREISNEYHPYLPIYQELPTASCGFVYLLVSVKCPTRVVVGETDNIKRTLYLHNTGYGPTDTRDTNLQPWGVYCFISGFEEAASLELGKQARNEFWQLWKDQIQLHTGPERGYDMAKLLVDEWVERGYNLVIARCGQRRPVVVAVVNAN